MICGPGQQRRGVCLTERARSLCHPCFPSAALGETATTNREDGCAAEGGGSARTRSEQRSAGPGLLPPVPRPARLRSRGAGGPGRNRRTAQPPRHRRARGSCPGCAAAAARGRQRPRARRAARARSPSRRRQGAAEKGMGVAEWAWPQRGGAAQCRSPEQPRRPALGDPALGDPALPPPGAPGGFWWGRSRVVQIRVNQIRTIKM